MKASQLKKIQGMVIAGLSLILVSCGGATGPVSEAKSTVGNDGGGSGTGGTGNTGGVTVTNIYSSPKQLGAGDLMIVDLNSSSSLDFSGVDPSAEFTFILSNAASDRGNFSVQVNSDLSDAEFEIAKSVDVEEEGTVEEDLDEVSNNVTEIFHEVLRLREKDLESLDSPVEADASSAGKSVSKAVSNAGSASASVGDSGTFKVLASLSSSSSFVNVTAAVQCVGSNVVFYVDDRVSDAMISNAEVAALCNQFDGTVGAEQNLFGSLSDVNGDGKVVVLLTPQVNKLGASGGGIVTGFFNATDLYPNSSTNSASNHMEILFIMVPDPSGTYGVPISKSFALSNLLPAVLPHELQHAINYNQHVFVNKGQAEQPWLNEGLSHMAEDRFGQNQENPSRYAIFLSNPSATSLVASSPGLAARGAAYLFLRFLYEQSDNGDQFLTRLVQNPLAGVANIDSAFAGRSNDFDQFGEFFLRWNVALAITDAGISQDRRFTYLPRVKDSTTGHFSGVCLRCGAEDGRSTILNGISQKSYTGVLGATTAQSAARYYKVSGVKDKMSFGSVSGGSGYGILIRSK